MNLGGTSTKIGVYDDGQPVWVESISHPREELTAFGFYLNQLDYRRQAILDELRKRGEALESFTAVVSRSGPVKAVPGGTYHIGKKMLDDCTSGKYGRHTSTLGVQIAYDLSREYGMPAYTVDPPHSDEMLPEAAYSGLPEITRSASFQALNHRAIARKYSAEVGKDYSEVDVVVAHMGSGITVAVHQKGKVIDVNNGLAGDGPFALERSGDLPVGDLIDLCYSGKFTHEEMLLRVNGQGGMQAYLGITDARVIDSRIESGDENARMAMTAMAYQVAKEIGSAATVLRGKVDAVVLTGGLAYWERLVALLKERVEFIAPVHIYPGENEMESLALGVYRVLSGRETARDYN